MKSNDFNGGILSIHIEKDGTFLTANDCPIGLCSSIEFTDDNSQRKLKIKYVILESCKYIGEDSIRRIKEVVPWAEIEEIRIDS